MTDEPKTKLITALVRAQAHVRPVPKDSTNQQHRYNYASSESVIDEARGALSSNGLCVLPTISRVTWAPSAEGIDTLHSCFELHHESGEAFALERETPVIVHAGKTAAQAVSSAQTTALAYMLRDLLLMSRLDDDGDPRQAPPPKREPRPDPSPASLALVADFEARLANLTTGEQLEAVNHGLKADYEARKISAEQLKPLVALRDRRRRELDALAKRLEGPPPDEAPKGMPGKARS